MFERRNKTNNLRSFQDLATKRKRTVKMGLGILNYRSQQLWSNLPENLRHINSQFNLKKVLGNVIVLTVGADDVS